MIRFVAGIVMLASTCQAQDIGPQLMIARAFKLDVKEAIKRLFKAVDVSYSIEDEVEGQVTINLHGATFEHALQTILRQAKATYRVEGGIYQIILSEIHGAGGVGSFDPPHISINKSESRQAFAKILDSLGYRTLIQPQINGVLTYSEVPTSFDQLMQVLCGRVGATYRSMSGRLEILKPSISSPTFALMSDLPYLKAESIEDSDYRYEVRGSQLSKIDRLTLRIVGAISLSPKLDAVDLDLDRDSDRSVLIHMAKMADANLVIAPEAKGRIRIESGPATKDHLLSCLSQSLKLPLTTYEGQKLILRQLTSLVSINLFDFDPIGENTFPVSAIKDVKGYLQIDAGRWRYLCQKNDLSILKWEPRTL